MSTTIPTSPATIYLGLDVHKESITVAVLPSDAPAPTQVLTVPAADLTRLRQLLGRLASGGAEVQACYEASGAGYVLQRQLTAWGVACAVIAPSLIPTRPGHQRKHDRYDAAQLARLYRAGELTPVRIPSEADERVRDLVRCRAVVQRELHRARQRLLKFLLKFLQRRGVRYTLGKTHWTQRHEAWLRGLSATGVLRDVDLEVFAEYLAFVHYAQHRRDALDQRLKQLVLAPALATVAEALACFRGIDAPAARVLATEIVDWTRFRTAGQCMAFMGLVPREASTGERERRGAITKAGNSYCRHVLVQAAWSYRHPPRLGRALATRQQAQSALLAQHAWRAQHRLHGLFRRVAARRGAAIAVVAVARELTGFLWAAAVAVSSPTADAPAAEAASPDKPMGGIRESPRSRGGACSCYALR